MTDTVTTLWPAHTAVRRTASRANDIRADDIRAHLAQARQLGDLAVEDLLIKITAAKVAAEQLAQLRGAVAPGVLDLAAKAAGRYEVDVQSIQGLLATAPRP